jgi:hypothetical protein
MVAEASMVAVRRGRVSARMKSSTEEVHQRGTPE